MKRIFALALALIAVSAAGCAPKAARVEKAYLDLFDTVTQITVYAPSEAEAEALIEETYALLSELHREFDIYNLYDGVNNIAALNASAGKAPLEVGEELSALLKFGVEMYGSTDGRVNIAMGSVLSLWHEAREDGLYIPDMEALREAAEHTDIASLVLDEAAGAAYIADPLMSLDVGAVAKGFAAERAAAFLRERGVESALISIGGNVRAIGERGDGDKWRVGVQSPFAAVNECVLALSDMSAVTSGAYQRYYELEGVRYHHIIDPDTLMPARYCEAVTVLCPDSGVADALSTALFNMPVEDGVAFVNALPDVEALWIAPDGAVTSTAGFSRYISD